MNKKYNILLSVFATLLLFSCEEKWQEHYETTSETVDMNVWDAIKADPNFSMYVQYMQDLQYDTLFQTDDTYTLFVPTNDAFTAYTDTVTNSVLDYHISSHFIQSGNIKGKRKIQTLSEKFALFDHSNAEMFLDEIKLENESPLYKNGKFFTIGQVNNPKPSIYEYFAARNPIFKYFIDSQDSIILDKEKSRPIGFDEFGNTIYDTVAEIYNEFEELYFPIREEFRYKTATLVFPNGEDYNQALTNMILDMGSAVYTDYNDVPLDWQNDILIPYLLEYGVFDNMIEKITFETPNNRDTIKMKNILGDSVVIDYQVSEKTICSNGYVYNYENFVVPDTLYKGSTIFEGEWMLDKIGNNKYAWDKKVDAISDLTLTPLTDYNAIASNDSMLNISFPTDYEGNFSVEFTVDNLFPREYLMVVRTHINKGGEYDVYVNDELVKSFNYDTYVLNNWVYRSVTGKRYKSEGVFNIFDCYIDNKAEYGKMKIKFVYTGPGSYVSSQGLVIDKIEFFPRE